MARAHRWHWSWAAAGAFLAVAAIPPPRAAAQGAGALALLTLEKGALAWDGVGVGSSLVAAERRIGVTLALDRNGESAANACAPFVATADHHGLTLTLGFRSPRPGAKVEWLRVRFEGAQIASSASDLAAELRARFPGTEWVRPAGAPADLAETDDLSPTYLVPGGKTPQAVRFAPREWMELAAPDCFR
jgi:hypothetical protein